jgi:tRNA U34 5-methylaminomethyl-2-thiouridine-forming methyltransferase MnmC
MEKLSLLVTTDGSHTVKNEATGDTYHSIHGAIQESQHVFIKHGLEYFNLSFPQRRPVHILEVGFGTGSNALLTWQFAKAHSLKIEYSTFEPFPLTPDLYSQLNYDPGNDMLNQLHACGWKTAVELSPEFTFTKYQTTIQSTQLPTSMFDVIYYDAFAPNSQPEMWTKETLERIRWSMNNPAILVTYCVKGTVKRNLKELGLTIETPDGPPGKRSMLRARYF